MTVEKITQNLTPLEATNKTNDVIDEVAANKQSLNASKADKSMFQVVSELPETPDENTFYFVLEETQEEQ